jgi:hypothetical protein
LAGLSPPSQPVVARLPVTEDAQRKTIGRLSFFNEIYRTDIFDKSLSERIAVITGRRNTESPAGGFPHPWNFLQR